MLRLVNRYFLIGFVICLVVMQAAVSFGQSQGESSKAVHGLECFNDSENDFIEQSIIRFERFLMKKYDTVDYQFFLKKVAAKSYQDSFYLNSELLKYWKSHESSEMFKRIWTKRNGIYYFNAFGKYYFCLKNSSNSLPLSSAMGTIRSNQNIDPIIVFSALSSELTKKDYLQTATKVFIINHVYAVYALNPKG